MSAPAGRTSPDPLIRKKGLFGALADKLADGGDQSIDPLVGETVQLAHALIGRAEALVGLPEAVGDFPEALVGLASNSRFVWRQRARSSSRWR
jgi:hypothetical protein